MDHTALSGHLLPGYDFVDNDFWPDDRPNNIDEDEDGDIDEGTGHGTHVTGLIADVAPHAQLLPIRVLNSDGGGTIFDIVQGIVYAVDHGAQVLNLSFSANIYSHIFEIAIQHAIDRNVIIVTAANGYESGLAYPASFEGVLSVGSIDFCEKISEFSVPYQALVDVFAPGEYIYSTYYDNNYAWWSGTSMAAPLVSGEAALLLQRNACSPDCIRQIVLTETKDLKLKLKVKKGFIEVEKAIKKKLNDKLICPNGKPISLTFEYTGESCLATSNDQNGKFKCSDDPFEAQSIEMILKKDVKYMKISPEGQSINMGDLVTISSKDNQKLKDELKLEIRQGDRELQTLEIDTSCKQLLGEGDQFGSLILREFIPEGIAGASSELISTPRIVNDRYQTFLPLTTYK